MVGAIGFEPTTPCSRSKCATRLRYAPTLFVPSLPADQLHKPARPQIRPVYGCTSLDTFFKNLTPCLTDGQYQAAIIDELLGQRHRDIGSASTDDDGIKGRFLLPAAGAVPYSNPGVIVPERIQSPSRANRKRLMPFDRIH